MVPSQKYLSCRDAIGFGTASVFDRIDGLILSLALNLTWFPEVVIYVISPVNWSSVVAAGVSPLKCDLFSSTCLTCNVNPFLHTPNICLVCVPTSLFLQLTPGGKAAQAGVGVGDWVVSIGDSNAEDMTHVEAQNKIRAATDSLTLSLSKWVGW